eukprot:118565-Chlamydomonas_euryale.AAC.9
MRPNHPFLPRGPTSTQPNETTTPAYSPASAPSSALAAEPTRSAQAQEFRPIKQPTGGLAQPERRRGGGGGNPRPSEKVPRRQQAQRATDKAGAPARAPNGQTDARPDPPAAGSPRQRPSTSSIQELHNNARNELTEGGNNAG